MHLEDYWEYPLDAGEHTLYQYSFKANADRTVLPAYGQATCGGGDEW